MHSVRGGQVLLEAANRQILHAHTTQTTIWMNIQNSRISGQLAATEVRPIPFYGCACPKLTHPHLVPKNASSPTLFPNLCDAREEKQISEKGELSVLSKSTSSLSLSMLQQQEILIWRLTLTHPAEPSTSDHLFGTEAASL